MIDQTYHNRQAISLSYFAGLHDVCSRLVYIIFNSDQMFWLQLLEPFTVWAAALPPPVLCHATL